MTQQEPAALEALLDDALVQSASFREAMAVHLEAEEEPQESLGEMVRSGRLVDRFLMDVEEALKQIFVAGLAYPDPELPEELASLALRAQSHGLPTAMGHLMRLGAFVENIAGQRDLALRQDFARRGWDETQRFLAWVRLFKVEHDFLTVQGRLAAESDSEAQDTRSRFPTRSATVWPLGLDLTDQGRLMVFCQDTETGRYVLLRDQLTEFDRRDPLGSRAISRLFQDAVQLRDVMAGVVRLEDHPVVARASVWLFRPAFQAIPRSLPVSGSFVPPVLDATPLDRHGLPTLRGARAVPGTLEVYVALDQRGVSVRLPDNHTSVGLKINDTLRLNLLKLLCREQTDRIDTEVVTMAMDDQLRLLSMTTEMDGRVFPMWDSTLFRPSSAVLARRAQECAHMPSADELGSLWLRAMTMLLGGVEAKDAKATRAAIAAFVPKGLSEWYRIDLTRFFLQEGLSSVSPEAMLRQVFALALHTVGEDLDLEALARVLGEESGKVSPADLRRIHGQFLYRAVWLVIAHDLQEGMRDALQALYDKRYAGELRDPTSSDVCVRALLMALLELGLDDETYTGPQEDGTGPALQFLGAYLGGYTTSDGSKRLDFMELAQLGDTVAWLMGADRYGAVVLHAGFVPETLSVSCVSAMARWLVQDRDNVRREAFFSIGDALLVVMAGALRPLLVL